MKKQEFLGTSLEAEKMKKLFGGTAAVAATSALHCITVSPSGNKTDSDESLEPGESLDAS